MSKFLHIYLVLAFSILTFEWNNCFCQQNLGTKPKISVNGVSCAIENQQFSCLTRTCDSVIIFAGDSIAFCTDANIDLMSDTNYYMQWNFNGSNNFPTPLHNYAPSNLPICYHPTWSTPGNYIVDIYNNNYLTAYPGSDCYSYGPSHWSIQITVLSVNGINNTSNPVSIFSYPNPATQHITIEADKPEEYIAVLTDIHGITISEKTFNKKMSFDLENSTRGIVLIRVMNKKGVALYQKKIIVK